MKKLCLLFSFVSAVAFGQPFTINIGSSPNMEDGDSARDAWIKQNSNNAWLRQNSGGGGSNGITDQQLKNALSSGTNSVNLSNASSSSLPPTAATTNWAQAANYLHVSGTNTPGQVPISTGTNDSHNSPVSVNGFLPFTALTFTVASNAFTNVVIGYLKFTNGDGRLITIPCGTNLP